MPMVQNHFSTTMNLYKMNSITVGYKQRPSLNETISTHAAPKKWSNQMSSATVDVVCDSKCRLWL